MSMMTVYIFIKIKLNTLERVHRKSHCTGKTLDLCDVRQITWRDRNK